MLCVSSSTEGDVDPWQTSPPQCFMCRANLQASLGTKAPMHPVSKWSKPLARASHDQGKHAIVVGPCRDVDPVQKWSRALSISTQGAQGPVKAKANVHG